MGGPEGKRKNGYRGGQDNWALRATAWVPTPCVACFFPQVRGADGLTLRDVSPLVWAARPVLEGPLL